MIRKAYPFSRYPTISQTFSLRAVRELGAAAVEVHTAFLRGMDRNPRWTNFPGAAMVKSAIKLRHRQWILRSIAAVVALAPFLARHGTNSNTLLAHVLVQICLSPLLATALAAGALIYLFESSWNRREMIAVLALTLLLAMLYWQTGVGRAEWVCAPLIAGMALVGMACLSAAMFLLQGRRLLAAAALPVGIILAGRFLNWLPVQHPRTLDPLLYAFDQSLGGQASFLAGRLFGRFEILRNVSFLTYILLPVAPAVAHLIEKRFGEQRILARFLTLGLVGSLAYLLFPAAGPAVAYSRDYPLTPPAVADLSMVPMLVAHGARNAMPSLHLSWTLLLFWNSRRWAFWMRAIFAALVGLTVIATLGLGEHYVADLVVAVPFTLAVHAAFEGCLFESATSALIAALWLLLLKSGTLIDVPNQSLNWILLAATVGGCFLMEWRLPAPKRNSKERRC